MLSLIGLFELNEQILNSVIEAMRNVIKGVTSEVMVILKANVRRITLA